jgi:uncharacterized protein YwgA
MRLSLSVKRLYGGNTVENYRLVAGLIEAHPDREVVGRTRLQKTVRLMQRIGMGTDYIFSIHAHGPYSEELQSDILVLERVGLGSEESRCLQGEDSRSVIRATPRARNTRIEPFRGFIQSLANAEQNVLDLAATYDVFREMGSDHADALRRLRAKRGSKFDGKSVDTAISLLKSLGLPAAEQARHAAT